MWLPIDDSYECSIIGEIRNIKTKRILKTWKAGYKRQYVYCRTGGMGSVKMGVHRIVAKLFLPQPTDVDTEVDHIDRDPSNNHASNLRWVSNSVNKYNKNPTTKARSNSKTGYLYISPNTGGYVVKTTIYHGWFKTIEEAIKYRDSLNDAL